MLLLSSTPLLEQQQQQADALEKFGVVGAARLAREHGPERCAEVLAYAQAHKLGPGWVVARLKDGEAIPKPKADDDDRRRFIEGKYAEFVRH